MLYIETKNSKISKNFWDFINLILLYYESISHHNILSFSVNILCYFTYFKWGIRGHSKIVRGIPGKK